MASSRTAGDHGGCTSYHWAVARSCLNMVNTSAEKELEGSEVVFKGDETAMLFALKYTRHTLLHQ